MREVEPSKMRCAPPSPTIREDGDLCQAGRSALRQRSRNREWPAWSMSRRLPPASV